MLVSITLIALIAHASACLIATFSWDPCNGNVWGTIVDNDITTGILGNETGHWPAEAPNMRMVTSMKAERAKIESIQLEVNDGSNGMPMSVIYFRREDEEGPNGGPKDSMKARFTLKRDRQGTYSGGWMGDCSEVVTAGNSYFGDAIEDSGFGGSARLYPEGEHSPIHLVQCPLGISYGDGRRPGWNKARSERVIVVPPAELSPIWDMHTMPQSMIDGLPDGTRKITDGLYWLCPQWYANNECLHTWDGFLAPQ